MASKALSKAFAPSVREIRFLFCQQAQASAGARYGDASTLPPWPLLTALTLQRVHHAEAAEELRIS